MSDICIRMPNWVGDVVMATPVLTALRTSFPDAHITAVIDAELEKIIRNSPDIDHVIRYRRKRPFHSATREFFRCTSAIRKLGCELAIVLPNSFSSALMMRLAGVPRRIGYARDLRSRLLTHALPRQTDDHGGFAPTYMAAYYLKLSEAAGARRTDARPHLEFASEDMESATTLLRKAGIDPDAPIFAIHPGAGYGPSKLWPRDRFAALAAMLHEEHGAQIAFIGSPSVTPSVETIQKLSNAPTFDLTRCGIDLHLLKCVIKRCRLLVSTDSGPRHYGIALGTPTLCIMGPTDPAYTDSGLPHDRVVRTTTDCGPCQKKICRTDHRCMLDTSPEMVFSACKQLLEREQHNE